MGYFDVFTANLLRQRQDGQRVIAPFGSLGRIYTVPTDAVATRITTAVRRMYQLMFVAIVGVQIALGWRWNLVVVPVFLASFYVGMHLLTRRLEPAGLRIRDLAPLSRRELQERAGRALGRGWLYALLVISGVFVALSLFLWIRTRESSMLLSAAFFALCGVPAVYMLARTRGR